MTKRDWRKDGYLAKYEVMPENEMTDIRKKFDHLESSRPNEKFIPQEINLHFDQKWILDLCIHPRILEAVENLIGPDIVLLSSTVFTKYPTEKTKTEKYSGDFVGWHQDMKYWGLVNLKPEGRIELASMWLAIDQADEENGAMQFLSGSHNSGFFDHVESTIEGNTLNENQDMIITADWKDKVVQTELAPGQCTFHDGMLVHGSKPTLNRRRMGLTAQFCQPSVEMVPMNYTKSIAFTEDFRKPILIRGEDSYGKLQYVINKAQVD